VVRRGVGTQLRVLSEERDEPPIRLSLKKEKRFRAEGKSLSLENGSRHGGARQPTAHSAKEARGTLMRWSRVAEAVAQADPSNAVGKVVRRLEDGFALPMAMCESGLRRLIHHA
jgi:hypothetical protein